MTGVDFNYIDVNTLGVSWTASFKKIMHLRASFENELLEIFFVPFILKPQLSAVDCCTCCATCCCCDFVLNKNNAKHVGAPKDGQRVENQSTQGTEKSLICSCSVALATSGGDDGTSVDGCSAQKGFGVCSASCACVRVPRPYSPTQKKRRTLSGAAAVAAAQNLGWDGSACVLNLEMENLISGLKGKGKMLLIPLSIDESVDILVLAQDWLKMLQNVIRVHIDRTFSCIRNAAAEAIERLQQQHMQQQHMQQTDANRFESLDAHKTGHDILFNNKDALDLNGSRHFGDIKNPYSNIKDQSVCSEETVKDKAIYQLLGAFPRGFELNLRRLFEMLLLPMQQNGCFLYKSFMVAMRGYVDQWIKKREKSANALLKILSDGRNVQKTYSPLYTGAGAETSRYVNTKKCQNINYKEDTNKINDITAHDGSICEGTHVYDQKKCLNCKEKKSKYKGHPDRFLGLWMDQETSDAVSNAVEVLSISEECLFLCILEANCSQNTDKSVQMCDNRAGEALNHKTLDEPISFDASTYKNTEKYVYELFSNTKRLFNCAFVIHVLIDLLNRTPFHVSTPHKNSSDTKPASVKPTSLCALESVLHLPCPGRGKCLFSVVEEDAGVYGHRLLEHLGILRSPPPSRYGSKLSSSQTAPIFMRRKTHIVDEKIFLAIPALGILCRWLRCGRSQVLRVLKGTKYGEIELQRMHAYSLTKCGLGWRFLLLQLVGEGSVVAASNSSTHQVILSLPKPQI